jgi:hypothetical protein
MSYHGSIKKRVTLQSLMPSSPLKIPPCLEALVLSSHHYLACERSTSRWNDEETSVVEGRHIRKHQ